MFPRPASGAGRGHTLDYNARPGCDPVAYDREKAVAYAHRWAFLRNPRYGVFDEIGGDCTNFISQCLYAGCGQMNPTPNTGWYYYAMNRRSPSWTSVFFLNRFLTENRGLGPYAARAPLTEARPGDVVQLSFIENRFTHSCLVVEVPDPPDVGGILIAAHTIDSDFRPLRTYPFQAARLLSILGARS